MSTSSIASSLSLQDLYQHQSYHTDPHIRRDSPLLGFDNYSDDPLHFPAPGFPRDLCDSKACPPSFYPYPHLTLPQRENAPLPLPPAVIPALHTRASALSLRKRASALSLRRIPTNSSIYPDSVRNAVYIDVDDVGERLGALLHASTLSRTSSFDSTLELDEDEDPDEDAAYFSSLYENPVGPSSQVYLGSPYAPSSPFSPPSPLDACLPYHSAYTSTTTSPAFTPVTPLSPPALLAPPPHVGSRWSLTSSLEAPPNDPDHPPTKKEKEKGKKGLAKQASSRDLKEREKAEKAPKRKRLTSFISRLSLGAGGLLSPTASSSATSLPAQEREMREAYLERDDPPMIIRSLASPSTHDTTPDAVYQPQSERDRDRDRPTHASANSWSSLIQGLGLGLVDDDPAPPIPAKDRTQHVPRSPRTKPALSIFTRLAAPASALEIMHSPEAASVSDYGVEFGEMLDRVTTPAGVTPTPPTPTPASPSYYSSSYGDAESRSPSPSSPMAFTCAPPSPTASLLDSDMGHGSRRERELERRRKQGEKGRLAQGSTVCLDLLPSPELEFVSAPSPAPSGISLKPKKEKKAKKSKAKGNGLHLNTNTNTNTNTDSDSILSLGLGVLSTAPTPPFSPISPTVTSPTSPSYAFPASSSPSAPVPASPERAVRSRRSTGLGGFRGLARRMRLGSTPAPPPPAPAVPKKDFVFPPGYGEYPPLPLSPGGENVYTPDLYPCEVEKKTRLVYPYPYVDPGVGVGRPERRGYGHARRRESVVL